MKYGRLPVEPQYNGHQLDRERLVQLLDAMALGEDLPPQTRQEQTEYDYVVAWLTKRV